MKFTFVPASGSSIVFEKNAATYRLLKSYDGMSIELVTHLTQTAPYQQGQTRIDTRFEPREISFDIMIQAASLELLQAAVKDLAASLNPLLGTGHLLYEYEDGTTYTIHSIGNNTPTISPSNRGLTWQHAKIDLVCFDPFWYSSPPEIVYFEASGNAFFPLDISSNFLGANGATNTLTNTGDVETPVTILISGEITNPVLTNTTTDQSMNITLVMSAGDTFLITTAFGNKTATYTPSGGAAENGFKYFDADSVFWQLNPGDNVVTLSDLTIGSGCIVSIEWENRYSGV